MRSPYVARSDSLRALFWRNEILQLLLWMQGEGFGEHLDAHLLERAFGVEPLRGVRHLDELVDEGLLCRDGDGRYRLTEEGSRYGDRIVADEVADPVRPGLAEPGPDDCDVRALDVTRARPGHRRARRREARRRRA
jgi:DNA-binding IclR family transcriptional regulator